MRIEFIRVEFINKLLKAKLFSRKIVGVIVFAAVVIYTIIFSNYTSLRHKHFLTYAWDLGIFNQAMYSTTRYGRFFYYTVEPHINPSNCFFGVHFSPILLLILPIYAIRPDPTTLLVIQSAVIASGAIPTYLLAKNELDSEIAALFFSLSYLFYFPLHGVNCFDFHIEAFLPAFLLFSLYYLIKGRQAMYYFSLILALMCLEQVCYLVLLIGVYAAWMHRHSLISLVKNRKIEDRMALVPILTITLAISWLLLANLVQRTVNPNPPIELKAGRNWKILGAESPLDIPAAVITNPVRAFEALSYDSQVKLTFLAHIFAPLLFLPLLGPSILSLAIPFFAFSLFSNYRPYYSIGFQYPAIIIPFLFVSSIRAIKRSNIVKAISSILLISNLLHFALFSPICPIAAQLPWPAYDKPYMDEKHLQDLYRIIELVPNQSSILTVNRIFPHVSNRINAYCIPLWDPSLGEKYYEVVRRSFALSGADLADYVLLDIKYCKELCDDEILLSWVLENSNYSLYAYSDGILLFKKEYLGTPLFLRPMHFILTHENLTTRFGHVVQDPTSRSGKALMHSKYDPQGTFWFGPYITLPPGNYTAIFRLKVDELGEGHIITLDVSTNLGITVFASHNVDLVEFERAGEWKEFLLSFSLEKPVKDVEFRGLYTSNLSTIYLDCVEVKRSG